MTVEDLETWKAFCEWLDARPRKCAYYAEVPAEWKRFVHAGYSREGRAAREARAEAKLIIYGVGWGYRLRKGWRRRLSQLEAEVNKQRPRT